jgi:hypothetical protein
MTDERWFGRDLEGRDSGITSSYASNYLTKTTKNFIQVTGVSVKIRTERLPNMSSEGYRYAHPLGSMHFV